MTRASSVIAAHIHTEGARSFFADRGGVIGSDCQYGAFDPCFVSQVSVTCPLPLPLLVVYYCRTHDKAVGVGGGG
jgi:hypothetical protein